MTTRIKKLAALLLALLMLSGTALADMRITNNVKALNQHCNLTDNNSALTKNVEKLSGGYRINRASDDAAGLALSERMQAQIAGLTAAQESAREGVSLVRTAEGALTEVHTTLNRMVELVQQSAGGAYSTASREETMEKMFGAIQQLAEGAAFANSDLLSGMFSGTLDESTMLSGFAYGTNVMTLFTNRTENGFAFSQLATDGSNAIIGSDNPQVLLVSPNGDIGIVGAGEAYIGAFDGAGRPIAGWNVYTDGEDLYTEPGTQLEITLNGDAVTTLTLSVGETAQLSVREAEQSAPEKGKVSTMDWASMRSYDGAPRIRLEHTINNQTENITAAESRIRDVDMAEEMMAYTKNNILIGAAQTMLEQANAVPQGVLELLE